MNSLTSLGNTNILHQNTPNILNINGNHLYICEQLHSNLEDYKMIGNRYFETNTNIDSIIFIDKKGNDTYGFIVYEKDQSFSFICGNGLGGAMYYLNKKYGSSYAQFINIKNNIIQTKIENETIHIHMGKIENNTNIDEIVDIEKQILQISQNIELFLNNPSLLYSHIESEAEGIYFLQAFQNIQRDSNFLHFIEGLELKQSSSTYGEPHIIIHMNHIEHISEFLLNYYMKIVTFLLRIDQKIKHQPSKNYMFYHHINDNNYKLYSSERGVNNGINFDQTGGCGSGSSCLGDFVTKENNSSNIINRSGDVIHIHKIKNEISMYFPIKNIRNIQNENNTQKFIGNAITENFYYNMEKELNITTQNTLSYKEILENIQSHFPLIASNINNIFGNILFSSCLHESEFPIDPYKLSSSYNGAVIAKNLNIDEVVSPYLDTLQGELKSFPNIKTKNGKIFNQIYKLIQELSLHTHGNKKGVKEVLKYINYRTHFIIDGLNTPDKNLQNILQELEQNFHHIIGITSGNILDSEYGKTILSIYKQTGMYDVLQENFKYPIKENLFNIFLIKTVQDQIEKNLSKIYELFIKQLLSIDYNTITEVNAKNIIYKALQDSVITCFIDINLETSDKYLLQEKNIINKKYVFSKNLSSLDITFNEKVSSSLTLILNSDDFGKTFLEKYLSNISLKNGHKPILLGDFNDIENGFQKMSIYFIIDENGKNKFFMGKGKEKFEIQFNYIEKLIKNPKNINNLQGCLLLMILCIGNIPMIGSERGYREIITETLKEHFGEKYSTYINFIKNSQLVGDYVPSKNFQGDTTENYYYSFPAGSDSSLLQDMFLETMIGGGKTIQSKNSEFLRNNKVADKLSRDEIVYFLKERINDLEKHNFSYILEKIISNLIAENNIDKIESIKEIEKIIHYTGDNITSLINNLYNRYLLITRK